MQRSRRATALGFCLLASTALACSQDSSITANVPEGRTLTRTVESGGRTRSYQAYIPSTVESGVPAPILISLHPTPGSGSDMRGITGFDQIARLLETIMVYPTASSDWEEGCDCSVADLTGVDDIQFLRDMIDDLDSETAVDRSRIYAVGFSDGGLAASHLACEMEELAAVGVVAATMYVSVSQTCSPPEPVSFVLIHGTSDLVYPAGGGGSGATELLGARETVDFWLDANGCAATPTTTSTQDQVEDGTTVEVELYHECDGGAEVEFYEVVNGGHTWPNPAISFPVSSGLKTGDIDAAAVLGVFFLRH